jgi:DNA-directed RNA polymerase subunit beta'
MAVHVPLSLEAQLEARVLMMSTNNILSPASGKPIIQPSQDIVLGLYYLTQQNEGAPGEGMTFGNMGEIEHALANGTVKLQTKIQARFDTYDTDGRPVVQRVETTPGRMLLGQVLPRHPNVPFSLINRLLGKKETTEVIDVVYRHCGQKETVIFADKIMSLGFSYSCYAGISFGKDDLVIPAAKQQLVHEAEEQVKEFEQQYQDGLITRGEKYNKVVDVWSNTTDKVADEMMKVISEKKGGEVNSVYMMAHSGARGSPAQIRQLAGMRGLMAKPSGEIIETPIISNFKEGLTVLEYFNSTHGARKGLADTALKTANSGYLTRRLVDVAQDAIIIEHDCGTKQGLTVRPVVEGGEVIAPLGDRILGRTAQGDIKDPVSGDVIIADGEMITEGQVERIDTSGLDSVRIRSVLTCESRGGICAQCYGRDLARGTSVNVGEAVGVIAAQSIGEPGTQLTMRTFHIGGAAQGGGEQSSVEASVNGSVRVRNRNVVENSEGQLIIMGRNTEIAVFDENGRERATHKIPYGAKLSIDDGQSVEKGQRLAEWDPYTQPIITEKAGRANYVDLIEGVSMREVTDETTGITNRVVIDWKSQPKGQEFKPRITLRDEEGEVITLANGAEARYYMSVDAILSVENGTAVQAGDVLARIPRESSKTRDITGGLPRVAELFEARKPKDYAIISEIGGRVEFGKDYKGKRRLIVVPESEEESAREYLIPKGKQIAVREGDLVEKGDLLMDGNPVPHDILDILGVEALAEYLTDEIQSVYRLQGVKINDKHLEVVIRQMLQKVEITEPGDSTYLLGEQIDREEYEASNRQLSEQAQRPASAKPVLQGITKASLQTRSFISAASFQETTRVLTEAAVYGKKDSLEGLKENVIVGRLIPAGTGARMNQFRRIAAQRDRQIQAANEQGQSLPAGEGAPHSGEQTAAE